MNMIARRFIPLCVVGCLFAVASPTPAPEAAPGRDVLAQIRAGGVAVLFRHPGTDRSQRDTDPKNLDNVAAQRHLTDAARAEARSVGAQLRRLHLPIVEVLSSRSRRCLEAASLMEIGEVQVSDEFTHIDRTVENAQEWERRQVAAKNRLMTVPSDGVMIVVTHMTVVDWLIGRQLDASLDEGEAVVVRPIDGGLKVIGRVSRDSWKRLSESATAPASRHKE